MRKTDPNAYGLLVKVLNLGSSVSSPASDLNYARAIKEIIQKDSYYNGNTTKALNDVEKLSERITDSGSQSDINTWTDCLRLVSNIRTTLAYDSLISIYPDNEMIKREYVAWHNLIETMAYYQDYLYSAETYLAVPEEKNTIIKRWLDYRRESIEKDRDIISGKLVYAIPSSRADSIKKEEDFNELFTHFHRYDKPYYYHPMWNEIRTAFDEWIYARKKISEQLEPHPSLSYQEHSKEVIDKVYSFIETLDKPYFRPILY